MSDFSESIVEDAALAWLESLGYAVLHGPLIAVGEPGAERVDPAYRGVLLDGRLRRSLVRLNPDLPPEAIEDAYRKLTRSDAPGLVERNRAVHRILVDGVTVEYRRKDGSIAGTQARVIDFDSSHWIVGRRQRVVQAMAHDHWKRGRLCETLRTAGGPRRRFRETPFSRLAPIFHRV